MPFAFSRSRFAGRMTTPPPVASTMSDRVAMMDAEQIVEVATAAEFFRAPKHPYAQALLRALPDGGDV